MTNEPKKLPVVTTSAAATAFCVARVDGPGGRHLWIDGNDKITAGNGEYGNPSPNAFSLPAQAVEDRDGRGGTHCPGSTPTCRASCYVDGLAKHAAETYAMYAHNAAAIREIIGSPDEGDWAIALASWIEANASGGFRWHVSGDLYSPEYARFVATVVQFSPNVRHWIYTRSFWLTAVFVGLENLTVNYSVDRDNYEEAKMYAEAHRGCGAPVRFCYLVTGDGEVPADLEPGSVIFPDYALRGQRGAAPEEQRRTSTWYQELPARQRKMVCPVDFYGKSDELRCGPCRKCIDQTEGYDAVTP